MVYKKYIKRGGKVYGPYLYHNTKKDGRVITTYHGKHKVKKNFSNHLKDNKNFFLVLGFLVALILVLTINLVYLLNLEFTGKVSVDLQEVYSDGENLQGDLRLVLKHGEFFPADSVLRIDNVGEFSEYTLGDIVNEETSVGNFYVENVELAGFGEGFGVPGEKLVYPNVTFSFRIIDANVSLSDTVSSGGSTDTKEDAPEERNETSENDTGIIGDEENETTIEETPTQAVSENTGSDSGEEPIEGVTAQDSEEDVSDLGEVVEDSQDSVSQDSSDTFGDAETSESSDAVAERSSDSGSEDSSASASSSDSSGESSSGDVGSSDSGGESSSDSGSSDSGGDSSGDSGGESAPITGEIIGEDGDLIVGNTSKDFPYVYDVPLGKQIEIVYTTAPVDVFYKGDQVIVTTKYSEFAQGFGEEYVTDETITLPIRFSDFGLVARQGTLGIVFSYNDTEILGSSVEIEVVNDTALVNETNETREEQLNFILATKDFAIDSKVSSRLLEEGETVRVIVKTSAPSLGQKIGSLDYEVMELSLEELALLGDEVEAVYFDEPVSLFVSDVDSIVHTREVRSAFSLLGAGKKVCVIDSGVDSSVVSYESGYDFVEDDETPQDALGHGTNVAYVLASLAPGAELYIAKVIDANGVGYESDVLFALDWCMQNNVDVISLSIGSGSYDGLCDARAVSVVSNGAVDDGIFVAAATGNDGSERFAAPACASKVVSVASTSKDDSISTFSTINRALDLLSPGEEILTKGIGGEEVSVSGTSMSVPVVSAGAVLVLENESVAPHELRDLFKTTGKPIAFDGITLSRIDVYNAVIGNVTMSLSNETLNQTNVTNETFEPLAVGVNLDSPQNNKYVLPNLLINFQCSKTGDQLKAMRFFGDFNGSWHSNYTDYLFPENKTNDYSTTFVGGDILTVFTPDGSNGIDTRLRGASPNSNYGSITSSPIQTGSNFLIKFNIGDLSKDVSILEANLTLFRSSSCFGWSSGPINVYRVTENWSEGQATWNDRLTSTPWTTSGGSYDSGTVWSGNRGYLCNSSNVTIDVTGLVEFLVNETYDDYGFIVVIPNSGFYSVHTSESTSTSLRPELSVLYEDRSNFSHSVNLSSGDYVWNCEAEDVASTKTFAPKNYSIHATVCAPSENANWEIDSDCVFENASIEISSGYNVSIQSGGNLTLVNSSVRLNSSFDGESFIFVESNGKMNVAEDSLLESNSAYSFGFVVYADGNFSMSDSTLRNAGWNDFISFAKGLEVYGNLGAFSNNVVEDNYAGIYFAGQTSGSISNNVFSDNERYSIYVRGYASDVSGVLVENNIIRDTYGHGSDWGIYIDGLGNNVYESEIKNNTISGQAKGIVLDAVYQNNVSENNLTNNDNGIAIWAGTFVSHNVGENNFSHNIVSSSDGTPGYALGSSNTFGDGLGNNYFYNNTFSNNDYGIWFDNYEGNSGNVFEDDAISNSAVADYHHDGQTSGERNSFVNVSFDSDATSFSASDVSKLYVLWNVSIKVVDGVGSPLVGVFVNISNATGVIFSNVTDSNGLTESYIALDFFENVTGTYNYNPYEVNITSGVNVIYSGLWNFTSGGVYEIAVDTTTPQITVESVTGDDVVGAPFRSRAVDPIFTLSLDETGSCRASTFNESYDDMSDDVSCIFSGGILCEIPQASLSQGDNDVYFACVDDAGNNHSAAQNTWVNLFYDTLVPFIDTITSFGGDSAAPYSTNDNTPRLVVSSSEDSLCRVSLADEHYRDMSDDVICSPSVTHGVSHTCDFSTLSDSSVLDVYIACEDELGNEQRSTQNNETVVEVDTQKPVQSGHLPVNDSTFRQTDFDVVFDLDEPGFCNWRDDVPASFYSVGANSCSNVDEDSLRCSISATEGIVSIFLACRDDTDANPNFDGALDNVYLNYTIDPCYFGGSEINVSDTVVCTDRVMEMDSGSVLHILSGGSVVLDNVEFSAQEINVHNGGRLYVKDSKGTIWQNDNLTISGEYILENATLRFNGTTVNGSIGGWVNSTGSVVINATANVTNGGDRSYRYFFNVIGSTSSFVMDNATLSYSGWNQSGLGFEVHSDDAQVTNSNFSNNYVMAFHGDTVILANNSFVFNKQYVDVRGNEGNVSANNFSFNNLGCVVRGSENVFVDNIFSFNDASGLRVSYPATQNVFYDSVSFSNTNGVYTLSSGNSFVRSSTFDNSYGVVFSSVNVVSPSNASFVDSVITNSAQEDVYLSSLLGAPGVLRFLNVSFNATKVFFYTDGSNPSNTSFDVGWYVDAFVHEGVGTTPVSGANVSVFNASEVMTFSEFTDAAGVITTQNVTEYVETIASRVYATNYTLLATKPYYSTVNTSFNVSGNTFLNVSMGVAPSVESVVIGPSSAYTKDDLYCRFNISDDSATLNVSVDWYRDSNLIFTDEVVDYSSGTFFDSNLSYELTKNNAQLYCEVSAIDQEFLNSTINQSSILTIDEYATTLDIYNDTSAAINQPVLFMANFSSGIIGDIAQKLGEFYVGSDITNVSTVRFYDCNGEGRRNCFVVGNDNSASSSSTRLQFYNKTGELLSSYTGPFRNIYHLEVGDLNNDGTEEIVVGSQLVGVRTFYSNGTQYWSYLGTVRYDNLVLEDLTGDGFLDIIAGAHTSSIVSLFNGSGGAPLWTYTGTGSNVLGLGLGNFSNNGSIAFSSYGITTSTFGVLNATGSVVWSFTSPKKGDLGLINLDEDSYDEILFGRNLNARDDDGTDLWTIGQLGDPVNYEVEVFDIDNDGTDEFVYGDGNYLLAYNANDTTFAQEWNFTNTSLNNFYFVMSLVLEDIDDDLSSEVVFGGINPHLYVLDSSGSLGYNFSLHGKVGQSSHSVAGGKHPAIDVSDYNGDGVGDVLSGGGSYAYLFQEGGCNISFNDSVDSDLVWNSVSYLWEYNRTFASEGKYSYDVTCEKGGYETRVASGELYVSPNSLPTVELFDPVNDTSTTNRTLKFMWNGTDLDFDVLTYQFNLTLRDDGNPGVVCSDSRLVGGLVDEEYVISPELDCFSGDGYYYEWSVRAHDGNGWGPWSEVWILHVDSVVSINLSVSAIDFGIMQFNESNDTDDNLPPSFILENDGNARVNVTINATDLWNSTANPSDYFLFKIDNTSEVYSFNQTASSILWTQVPASTSPLEAIIGFNWQEENDSAEIDVNVTVPGIIEGAGSRTSTIYFTARLAE